MLKGKKAAYIAILLVIITLIAMASALTFFFKYRTHVSDSVGPPVELVDAVYEKQMLEFYVNEAGRLSAAKAFSDISEKGASSGECSFFGDYIIWNEKCKPGNVNGAFLEKFNSSFNDFIKSYTLIKVIPKGASLNDGTAKIELEDIAFNASNEKGYVKYNATITCNNPLEINLQSIGINLDDFESIYEKAFECKDKNLTKAVECMKIPSWKANIELLDNYLLFNMKTEKSFLIDNTFAPVSLNFALTI